MQTVELTWVKVTEYPPRKAARVLIYFPTCSTSVMDALYTHEGRYIRDNMDFTDSVEQWAYPVAPLNTD